MLRLAERLLVGSTLAVTVLTLGLVAAHSQELPVPCYAFQQDALGRWIATTPLSMNTHLGMIEIMPGHPVSVPVANILNARCP